MTAVQFELLPVESFVPEMQWERYAPAGTCGATYYLLRRGRPSGVSVQHCGHPTANFPYTVETPTKTYVAPNGRGFALLRDAKAFAARLPIPAEQHERDEDCTVGDDDLCQECGVFHGGPPCPECGKFAFHTNDCPELFS